MTEATKKLVEMLYYDDYLYHLYIRSGRDKLVEKLQQRISNNSESKKELEIIDYINKHKNEIHEWMEVITMTLRALYIDLAMNYGEEFRPSKVIITDIDGKTVYYEGKAKNTPKELLDKRLFITSNKNGMTVFKIEV